MGWGRLITHRQFRTELAWEREELNNPSLTDQYIMQLTLEVRRVISMWTKNPGSMKMEGVRLKFKDRSEFTGPMTKQETDAVTARSKANWARRLGVKKDKGGGDQPGNRSAAPERKINLPPGHEHTHLAEQINKSRQD